MSDTATTTIADINARLGELAAREDELIAQIKAVEREDPPVDPRPAKLAELGLQIDEVFSEQRRLSALVHERLAAGEV